MLVYEAVEILNPGKNATLIEMDQKYKSLLIRLRLTSVVYRKLISGVFWNYGRIRGLLLRLLPLKFLFFKISIRSFPDKTGNLGIDRNLKIHSHKNFFISKEKILFRIKTFNI